MKASENLMEILKVRFAKNANRHPGLSWEVVLQRIAQFPEKSSSLQAMESTGGEPDVTFYDPQNGIICFMDCSAESPAGRRSLCYDREALDARKEFKPESTALDMAASMGIELLDEEDYRYLQTLGKFDTKTSSWIKTPSAIRKLGGALFCDRRYDHVFTYHNGAQSYYAARGFRGKLII